MRPMKCYSCDLVVKVTESKTYATLGYALVSSNLKMIAREILDYPPRPSWYSFVKIFVTEGACAYVYCHSSV